MLESIDQEHLLHFVEELETEQLEELLGQLETIDLPEAVRMVERANTDTFQPPAPDLISPADFVPRRPENEQAAREHGEQLLKAGKVAAFTVAGGKTRLGWNGPKGSFPHPR